MSRHAHDAGLVPGFRPPRANVARKPLDAHGLKEV